MEKQHIITQQGIEVHGVTEKLNEAKVIEK
jgi:hypothetical protein